jgi:prophage antirepressor-like protein
MAKSVITPSVFIFQQNHVRTALQPDGSVWFAVKDVCAILNLTWSGATLKSIPKEWQGMLSFNTPSGVQRLRVSSEPAVSKLAFRSNKPEADAFTNWVASEVLPSIRKTGKFETAPGQEALPPAEPKDPNILPIRVSFLRTRDFKTAHLKADRVGRVVFNEACRFSQKLYDLARELNNAFGPTPSECRGETHFDAIVRYHHNAMKSFAEGVMRNAGAFVDQCNALESLARMLVQSDHGTAYDSVRKLRVIMEDGTGRIFPE